MSKFVFIPELFHIPFTYYDSFPVAQWQSADCEAEYMGSNPAWDRKF